MVPSTYSDWCTLFDEIERNARNEDYIEMIRCGKISWTSGVAERFIQNVSKLIRSRMNKAQDVYQRQMKNSMGTIPRSSFCGIDTIIDAAWALSGSAKTP